LSKAFISKAQKGGDGIEVHDYKKHDPPAPLITKYVCGDAPEGYNFTIVENKSTDQKFKETMEYSTLDGLKILGDEESKKYNLTVEPNDTKCIIFEAGFDGFGTQGRSGTQITSVKN